ncbi:DUF1707 domain-containing protein [Corynebacterium hansenii]|uniref:DUF1707 domain-containing protein n=1 Tax=Corynebacterium hansenii TaxID=394964 RepID=A0ABV7ZPA4_9CORY|nr:DUF1707 domain-containing protein [Corynebacterium hansenii]WJY99103.1 hypothetical protein CHAN_02360 [Corynebacterium hansenii]
MSGKHPTEPEISSVPARLSDGDRSAAMEALGAHLSDGRIDVGEFDARSAVVARAVVESDLRPAFEGLGGVPDQNAGDPELDRIRTRGRLAENIDWIGVALAIGLGALFFITGWAPPGFALLAIAVCSIGGRMALDFDEDDEYEAMKEADRRRRLERIEGTRDPEAGV